MFGVRKQEQQPQEQPQAADPMAAVTEAIQKMEDLAARVEAGAAQAQQQQPQQPQPQPQPRKTIFTEDDDFFESMSRKQMLETFRDEFIDLIGGVMEPYLDSRLGEINTRLEGLGQDFTQTKTQTELEKFFQMNPGAEIFQNEISELHKQYASMDLEDVFTLARSKNPEKAQQWESRMQGGSQGYPSAPVEQPVQGQGGFGGGQVSDTSSHTGRPMSLRDAVTSAVNEVKSKDGLN